MFSIVRKNYWTSRWYLHSREVNPEASDLLSAGAVPIPGCKSEQQAKDLAASLTWDLEDDEVAMLDEKLDSLN